MLEMLFPALKHRAIPKIFHTSLSLAPCFSTGASVVING
jgi:hypothetical protein